MPDFWESVASGLGKLAREAFIAVTDEKPEKYWTLEEDEVVKPAEKAAATLNAETLLRSLNDRIPDYVSAVEKGVAQAISSSETSDLLEIKVYQRHRLSKQCPTSTTFAKFDTHLLTVRPKQTQWAYNMFKYMQDKSDSDQRYEAGIERIVMAACTKASEAYFSSTKMQDLVNEKLVASIKASGEFQQIIMKELKDTGKLVKKEAKDAINVHGQAVAADRVHDALQHAVAVASATTAGTVATKVIAGALAMPAVKVAIIKGATVAFGSTAVHGAITAAAKHCGITTLAVCFLGHTTAASFVGVVAVPLIAAVIAYQWNTLPSTLAKEMAPKIAAEIRKSAGTVNESVVSKIKEKVVEAILDVPKEMMEKIHEAAMEGLDYA